MFQLTRWKVLAARSAGARMQAPRYTEERKSLRVKKSDAEASRRPEKLSCAIRRRAGSQKCRRSASAETPWSSAARAASVAVT